MFEKKNHGTDIQFPIYILGNVTYYVIKKNNTASIKRNIYKVSKY